MAKLKLNLLKIVSYYYGHFDTAYETTVKFDGKKTGDASDPDSKYVHLNQLEYGANFIVSMQLKMGLFIRLNYNLGLNNFNSNENIKMTSHYFSIGGGFSFKGQQKK